MWQFSYYLYDDKWGSVGAVVITENCILFNTCENSCWLKFHIPFYSTMACLWWEIFYLAFGKILCLIQLDPVCKRKKITSDTEFFSENWIPIPSPSIVGKVAIIERMEFGIRRVWFDSFFYGHIVYANEVTKPHWKSVIWWEKLGWSYFTVTGSGKCSVSIRGPCFWFLGMQGTTCTGWLTGGYKSWHWNCYLMCCISSDFYV